MRILGISAFYHDSAAALLENGHITAAAQEERFTRKKHDARFPVNAIQYCLDAAGIDLSAVDYVAFYEKPFLKFERLVETYVAFAPKGFTSFRKAMPIWLHEKLFQKDLLRKEFRKFNDKFDWQNKLLFSEHHLSHAASAFFPSPFKSAAVLTLDGVGEWTTSSLAFGNENKLDILKEIHFPHSLGLLYSAFTYYLGFKVNSGEYKVMGLAPYGEPRFVQTILDNLIDIKPDGSFRLDQSYFNYCTGLTMTNSKFDKLLGRPARKPEADLEQFHMDVAASVQAATEHAVLKLTRTIAIETGAENLCLAGGVALNCVANGKVLRDGKFKNIWIQPASGDAGGALGAALAAHYIHKQQPRTVSDGDAMKGSYLGPRFSQQQTEQRLRDIGARLEILAEDDLLDAVVEDLAAGKAIGWFSGRMEYGPRALGSRSILADPRNPTMQKTLNLRIKYRESFRPFAPMVLREDVAEWFELDCDSPYMLLVANVLSEHRLSESDETPKLFGIEKLNVPRSKIPAVTHVDYSARIQTVHRETNPTLHSLLSKFKARTGCPVLVNTSFNVRGEPIVCTPEDAFRCFMGTEIETLVCENALLKKELQDPTLRKNYKDNFQLD